MRFARTRHALLWIWRQLLAASLIALLLLAVYVGVGRQLMPLAGEYKGRLEAQLSAAAGVVVRIGSLRGQWDGLTPVFILNDIEIRDPHHPERLLTRLPRLVTQPAMLASLLNREPRLSTTLEGLSLHLQQLPDGRVQVGELSSLESADPAAAHQALGLLLRQPALVLEDSHITLALEGKPALEMADLNLTSLNEGSMHWLRGSFHLPHTTQSASLILKYRGDPLDWRQGRLQAWMNLPPTQLADWVQSLPVPGLKVQGARLGGQCWLDFDQGNLTAMTGRLAVDQATLSVGGDPYAASNLSGLLSWRREQGNGWVLAAEHLAGSLNGHPLPAPRFALRSSDHELELIAAQLGLAPLRDFLLGSARLPPPARPWLASLAPAGWVPHLRLTLDRGADGSLANPVLTVEFKAVSLKAYRGLPAASGLAGWLHVGNTGGLVSIDSRYCLLELRDWFHEPLAAESLTGGFRLTRTATAWQVDSNLLHVSNADASGRALVSLSVPADHPDAARMDLLAAVDNARAASAWRYVPYAVAGNDTVAWLKAAATAGTVQSGQFLYDGPLGHVRGEPDGRLQMHFQLRDATLAYQPGWPPVEGLDGDLSIDGNRLWGAATTAHVYGSSGSNLQVSIPDLSHPLLNVAGDLRGPAADVTRLFRESPLREQLGTVAQTLEPGGDLSGHLELQVPFDSRPVQVAVTVDLPGNILRLPRQSLEVDDLRGEISYSSAQGLVSHHLQGQLFGESVESHITSQMRGGDLALVHVTAEGHAGVPALQRWSGASLLKYMEGGASYQADILLPTASDESGQLIIGSTLEGLRVNLPAPFGKGPEALPMRYQSDLGAGELNARLTIPHRLSVGLLWSESGRLRGASVHAGYEGAAANASANSIALDLHVNRINVSEWQAWLDRTGGEGGDGGGGELPPLNHIIIDSPQLLAGGYILHNARVDARRQAETWTVALSSERLSGTAEVTPGSRQPMQVSLDYLQWPLIQQPAGKGGQGGQGGQDGGGAVLKVPVLLEIKELGFDQWSKLGPSAISARVLPTPYGLTVDQIDLRNPLFAFKGTVNWNFLSDTHTHVTGIVNTGDAQQFLAALGYTPMIESRDMTAVVTDFNWPGDPGDFDVAGLSGQFSVQSCKGGRLLNVGIVTSASRIFGLFDIENIKQRLQGNFSDVTKKGVSYDKASMAGQLRNGVITPSRFAFTGPSMSANGTGKVDLNSDGIDQQISVSVPVSSVLPAVGFVLAGPWGAGGTLFAEKLLNKQLGKLTTMHYHITGTWDDPDVAHGAVSTGNDKVEALPECGT